MHYKYCPLCGNKLIDKNIGDEGLLPYCQSCQKPYWDSFSPSIICAVINEYNEIALLKQNYVSTTNYVLVAGMVKMGETIEETVIREVQEELGLDVISVHYLKSYYYEKKDLLMSGFVVKVNKSDFKLSCEVDEAIWHPINEALSLLHKEGIAWKLVNKIISENIFFTDKSIRSTAKAVICHNNKILLNKCFDPNNGHYYSLPGGGQNKYESIYDAIKRECLEETGYQISNPEFIGICEEICDNKDTRTNYSQYAHKFYHIYKCSLASEEHTVPEVTDDMQEGTEWIDIDNLNNVRLLPEALGRNITKLIASKTPADLGSTHIPYNHG